MDFSILLQYETSMENETHRIDEIYQAYEENPEQHPDFINERNEFLRHRKNELLAQGKDIDTHNYGPDLAAFWMRRMHEIKLEEIEEKKKDIQKKLGISSDVARFFDRAIAIKRQQFCRQFSRSPVPSSDESEDESQSDSSEDESDEMPSTSFQIPKGDESYLENATDDDLKIFLRTFSKFPDEEQALLIKFLDKLEKTDPKRVKMLSNYVDAGDAEIDDEVEDVEMEEPQQLPDDESDDESQASLPSWRKNAPGILSFLMRSQPQQEMNPIPPQRSFDQLAAMVNRLPPPINLWGRSSPEFNEALFDRGDVAMAARDNPSNISVSRRLLALEDELGPQQYSQLWDMLEHSIANDDVLNDENFNLLRRVLQILEGINFDGYENPLESLKIATAIHDIKSLLARRNY